MLLWPVLAGGIFVVRYVLFSNREQKTVRQAKTLDEVHKTERHK
jgi:hypothetical protein